MFETERFKKLLDSTVSIETDNNNLERYQPSIIDYLQGLATRNESTLMEREVRKAAAAQRGIPDALMSASILVKEAATYATADKRKLLTQADVEKAYQAKFCRVWPFCKE